MMRRCLSRLAKLNWNSCCMTNGNKEKKLFLPENTIGNWVIFDCFYSNSSIEISGNDKIKSPRKFNICNKMRRELMISSVSHSVSLFDSIQSRSALYRRLRWISSKRWQNEIKSPIFRAAASYLIKSILFFYFVTLKLTLKIFNL